MSTRSNADAPVGTALIGTGLFAKAAYVPLLRKFEEQVSVKYVWSRSEAGASDFVALGDLASKETQATWADDGFQAILDDPNVEALLVVLPAPIALQFISRALAAGKSVMSEKPVAGSVSEAIEAVQRYRALTAPCLWMVAENYRFEGAFQEAAARVPSLGNVLKMDLLVDMGMTSGNPFFGSTWRRDDTVLPGGFMVDSGVHHMAALHLVAAAGAAAGLPTAALARSSFHEGGVSDPDTVCGVLTWESGLQATISLCMSSVQPQFRLSVVAEGGSLEVSRGGWHDPGNAYTVRSKLVGEDGTNAQAFPFEGVDCEMSAFIDAVVGLRGGGVVGTASGCAGDPERAVLDLVMIRTLLDAAGTVAGTAPVQELPWPAALML